MAAAARRIVLASRPSDEPKPSDFRLRNIRCRSPGRGEVLLRTHNGSRSTPICAGA